MKKKRFVYEEEHYNFPIKKRIRDTQNNETYDLKKCCGLLNEQQATINKLQDENEQLREINKELGDDLHNCRLNKNIIREKLKLWQDVHKEYGIYSINDFEESFELDAKINKEKGI